MPDHETPRELGKLTSEDERQIKKDIEKGREEWERKKEQRQKNPNPNDNPFLAKKRE